jgi:methanethiol S-methyltransferase
MNLSTVSPHPTLTSQSKVIDSVFIVLAIVFGAGSVVLLILGDIIDLSPIHVSRSNITILIWDAFLSLCFFVQHSGMVRKGFRKQVTRIFPARYDGAIYAISSGVALAIVALFWQRSEIEVLILEGIPRTVAAVCNLLGVLLFVYGAASLRPFDPLGIGPIRAHLRAAAFQPGPIVIRGPYRWVRHPLYLAVLILFWTNPNVTADRLLLNILWTVWIVVATVLEERDLTNEFGEAYLQYKRTVPMLVPWKIPRPAVSQ